MFHGPCRTRSDTAENREPTPLSSHRPHTHSGGGGTTAGGRRLGDILGPRGGGESSLRSDGPTTMMVTCVSLSSGPVCPVLTSPSLSPPTSRASLPGTPKGVSNSAHPDRPLPPGSLPPALAPEAYSVSAPLLRRVSGTGLLRTWGGGL